MTTAGTKRKRVADEIAARPLPKRPHLCESTDKSRWRLKNEDGVQTWVYLEKDDDKAKAWPQSYADKWFLGFDTVSSRFV